MMSLLKYEWFLWKQLTNFTNARSNIYSLEIQKGVIPLRKLKVSSQGKQYLPVTISLWIELFSPLFLFLRRLLINFLVKYRLFCILVYQPEENVHKKNQKDLTLTSFLDLYNFSERDVVMEIMWGRRFNVSVLAAIAIYIYNYITWMPAR